MVVLSHDPQLCCSGEWLYVGVLAVHNDHPPLTNDISLYLSRLRKTGYSNTMTTHISV